MTDQADSSPGKLVTSPLYPRGLQFEWYAIDRSGLLAILNTAGCGPIPEIMLTDEQAWERADSALLSLPERCTARSGPGRYYDSEFEQIAQRGLFAYDWSDVGQPYTDLSARYELQAYPVQPLTVADLRLPPEIAAWVAAVRLDVLFTEAHAVDLKVLLSVPYLYAHEPAPTTSLSG